MEQGRVVVLCKQVVITVSILEPGIIKMGAESLKTSRSEMLESSSAPLNDRGVFVRKAGGGLMLCGPSFIIPLFLHLQLFMGSLVCARPWSCDGAGA